MTVKLKRLLSTTFKDLVRNKSITLSSISVMTLVFLVLTIFVSFGYTASKVLNYIETREHLEVFFNLDASEEDIMDVKQKLEESEKTAYVSYTSPEEANEYLRKRHSDNPLILGVSNPEFLPAKLAVKANRISYVTDLNDLLKDLDPNNELIDTIVFNEDSTNLLKDLLFWVKLVGAILFFVLVSVIFLVSLITVEMSITNRGDEISIMQLVGGGKWYIRAPFIFQGAFYGIVGALIAAMILLSAGVVLYFVKDQSPTLTFISQFFADLDWPAITIPRVFLFLIAEVIVGGLTGSVNSVIAVMRNLK